MGRKHQRKALGREGGESGAESGMTCYMTGNGHFPQCITMPCNVANDITPHKGAGGWEG